jgi:hypothetical protein
MLGRPCGYPDSYSNFIYIFTRIFSIHFLLLSSIFLGWKFFVQYLVSMYESIHSINVFSFPCMIIHYYANLLSVCTMSYFSIIYSVHPFACTPFYWKEYTTIGAGRRPPSMKIWSPRVIISCVHSWTISHSNLTQQKMCRIQTPSHDENATTVCLFEFLGNWCFKYLKNTCPLCFKNLKGIPCLALHS